MQTEHMEDGIAQIGKKAHLHMRAGGPHPPRTLYSDKNLHLEEQKDKIKDTITTNIGTNKVMIET